MRDYYDDALDGARARSVFHPGAKLQGNAQILLDVAGAELINLNTADGKPRVFTVSLAAPGNQALVFDPTTAMAEIIAQLYVGVGGISYTAELDFVQGVQFSLSASALTIQARWARFPGAAPPAGGTPAAQTVAASVALGAIGIGARPQRTLGSETVIVPGATGAAVNIPKFARTVRLEVIPFNAQARLDFSNGFQVPVVAFPSGEIPFPSDMQQISITNVGAVNISSPRLIFELAL